MIKNITLILFTLIFFSCNQIDKLNENPITIEAHFMQYACGDWNDDMNIISVTDTAFNFLVGKDIDPLFLRGEHEISGWLLDNKSEEYGMNYRLTGYIGNCPEFGCDGVPKFWITSIKKMNGEKFDKSGEN